MKAPLAVWRVLAYAVAVPEGVQGTDSRTTEGGRDKRRGTDARYVVVLLQLFTHFGMVRGAAPSFNTLIYIRFHRAAASEAGI
ncbi:conserved hypothetical protein [Rhizobium sp. EC-SD404]|nr:conserved hypothetical protein [Rhizobium sp. EC-SD404]